MSDDSSDLFPYDFTFNGFKEEITTELKIIEPPKITKQPTISEPEPQPKRVIERERPRPIPPSPPKTIPRPEREMETPRPIPTQPLKEVPEPEKETPKPIPIPQLKIIPETETETQKPSWTTLPNNFKQFVKSENFIIQDSLGDGNCLFRSLEKALEFSDKEYSHLQLREIIGKYINQINYNDFKLLLQNYTSEVESGEFVGKWDPVKIMKMLDTDFEKARDEFIKNINTPGNTFQGDDVTLSILSNILELNILIIREKNNNYTITKIDNPGNKLIILYYKIVEKSCPHYQTIGYRQDINSDTSAFIFDKSNLPNDIKNLYTIIDFQKWEPFKVNSIEKLMISIGSSTNIFQILSQALQTEKYTSEYLYNKVKTEDLNIISRTFGLELIIIDKNLKDVIHIKNGSITILILKDKNKYNLIGFNDAGKIRKAFRSNMLPKSILELKSKVIKEPEEEIVPGTKSNLELLYDYFNSRECKTGKGGFNMTELKEICKKLNISTSGTKDELCNKIKKYFNIYLTNQQSRSKVPRETPQLQLSLQVPESKLAEIIETRPVSKVIEEIPQSKSKSKVIEEIPQSKSKSKVIEEIPQSKSKSKVIEEIPQSKSKSKVVEEIPQSKSKSKVVEEIPKNKVVEEVPQSKSKSKVVEEIPQSKSKSKVIEEIPQSKSKSKVVEEVPQSKVVEEVPQSKVVEEVPQSKVVEEVPQSKVVEEVPQIKSKSKIVEEAPVTPSKISSIEEIKSKTINEDKDLIPEDRKFRFKHLI